MFYLDTKDYLHNTTLVDYLAQRGYYALSFDPPGTWESAGDISIYNTTSYIQAINELIEALGNKPTLLLGHSRGGSAAMLASSNPHIIGVVTIMGSYGPPSAPKPKTIEEGVEVSFRDMPDTGVKNKMFALPLSYFEDGSKYNPAEALKKFKKPKLVINGTFDEFNELEAAKKTYAELPEPKMTEEVEIYHDYRLDPQTVGVVNNIVGRFLDKYF